MEEVTKVLPKVRQVATHHAALPYTQIPAFLEALRAADAGEPTKLAFEFLMLTATRTSEVLGARWEEIDRAAKTWTIPAVRIKASREHRVPLSPRCLELLDRAEAIADGGPYVFLAWLREHPDHGRTPVLILTGRTTLEADDQDMIQRYRAYVFYKPLSTTVLVEFLTRLTTGQPS